MLPPSLPLHELQCTVVDTRKEGGHTNYALRIRPKHGARSECEVVYRRYSAFVQLQRLVRRHLDDTNYCCGGDNNCLLASFVGPVFTATEFSVVRGGGLLRKNAASVVQDRKVFLGAFLVSLEEALAQCPPLVIHRCEQEHCKLTKLLKSFYGCLAQPSRLARARSV